MAIFIIIGSILLGTTLYFKGENLRKDVLEKEEKKIEKPIDKSDPPEYPGGKHWR